MKLALQLYVDEVVWNNYYIWWGYMSLRCLKLYLEFAWILELMTVVNSLKYYGLIRLLFSDRL